MFKENSKKIIDTINNNKFVQKTKSSLIGLLFGRAGVYILLIFLQLILILKMVNNVVSSSRVYGGSILASAIILIFILNLEVNPYEKLSRSILIAILPFVGIILFILAHFDLGHKYEERKVLKIEEETKDLHHRDENLMRKLKKEDKDFYNLATYLDQKGNFPTYSHTKAKYYSVGEDAFADMLEAIKKAEDFIFIEYFIINPGYMWGTMLEELIKKVNAGVEVRLMYDGSNQITRLPKNFPKKMEEVGIKCSIFSPIYPIVSTYYNNRDHRKILVVDGEVAFTGGLNIADEYINVFERFGHRKDTSVRIEGAAVLSYTLMFLQLWHSKDKDRDFSKYLRYKPQVADGYVITFGDNPLRKEKLTKHLYMHLLNTAEDYVYIMTPYLILDNEMMTAICFAADRGVDVRIVLPAIPDKKVPYLLAKSHYKRLLESNVKIYEYLPGFVHAKTRLSDDKKVSVGSVNLDYRALYLNFESTTYLYKKPMAQDVYKDFEVVFSVSKLVTMEDVKAYPTRKKIAGAILKPFAPLL